MLDSRQCSKEAAVVAKDDGVQGATVDRVKPYPEVPSPRVRFVLEFSFFGIGVK